MEVWNWYYCNKNVERKIGRKLLPVTKDANKSHAEQLTQPHDITRAFFYLRNMLYK